jgi:hypothetical protein|uniref:Uncharacterized protein n=1 Tax=Siphoviridae sp. ctFNZ2 TaxID=2823572 RepID=A0A8S5LAG7_9CAUD|nr:MAG TPA: hypothetical protein [Siphoviridae sp. ctFNZ2]
MSIVEEIKQQISELQKMLAIEENKLTDSKNKCPFKYGDVYFVIDYDGKIRGFRWENMPPDYDAFIFKNAFKYEENAQFEREKRLLLIEFHNFRDEVNGDWEPNWFNGREVKYFISYNPKIKSFLIEETVGATDFTSLGYFKKEEDCLKAIDMFGEEIKRLLVEELPF